MQRKLFQVQETAYTVSGTLVLAAKTEKENLDFKKDDVIVLVKPDGNEIETKINGVDLFKKTKPFIESISLNAYKKEDVPIGTIVYKIE